MKINNLCFIEINIVEQYDAFILSCIIKVQKYDSEIELI
jgi:hypothetical protein